MSDSHSNSETHDDDDEHVHSHGSHDEHGDGGHGEPWLVSYADLMTLLFGFFVLMYSFEAAKNSDDASMVRMRKELAQFFGGTYINPLTQVAQTYTKEVQGMHLSKDVTINEIPEGLEITFQSATLFESGASELTESARGVVLPLVKMLREQKTDFAIRVEGYTDDNPIRSSPKFPSNWELSGARASSVIRIFEELEFNPDKLTALGYGATRPAFPNRDSLGKAIPENQARNRRVKIFIINNLEAKSDVKNAAMSAGTNEVKNETAPQNP